MLDCLARWLLDHWQTRQARRDSMDRMRSHMARASGPEAADYFMADLRRRVLAQHKGRKA